VAAKSSENLKPAAVIILAAGQGTRMKSTKPKVLHEVMGMPLVGHVLSAAAELEPENSVVVVGHGRDQVINYLQSSFPSAKTVTQEQQLGTGHATTVALDSISAVNSGPVLILAGDTPLLTSGDLSNLVNAANGVGGAVLTAHLTDPTGYGRIIRNENGDIDAIVEHRDATENQKEITEVNSGVYVFEAALLRAALAKVDSANDQGEQYLTDVVGILRSEGHSIRAVVTAEENILGVNDRRQLAEAGQVLRKRITDEWMLAGVTMVDPTSVWIDRTVVLEPDVTLLQNIQLTGTTKIKSGAVVGPDCTLTDTVVDNDATVVRSTTIDSHIGMGASVGPFTYLRPGTVLGPKAKAGGFVEMKNAVLGENAKVPHLSYVGDAEIGEGTNIGAATVFVNYDGVEKHRTVVGKHVRVGSDSMLVAPITIGDGAYTAAGSVITEDVPAGAMAVGRARQRNILDWVLRRRPGSDSAKAAVADSSSQVNSTGNSSEG
jgi:bifunctional UDP-N-acetylglucosamine pyrophosphorylase/glucosamine-1-phosphate N-acetyltransferase